MTIRSFTLDTPAGVNLEARDVGFPIAFLTVDNVTSQWVTIINSGGAVVPPYSTGVPISLDARSQQLTLRFLAPSGVVMPPVNAQEKCTVTCYDTPVSSGPVPGFTPGTPQQLIATRQAGTNTDIVVNVPTGTHALVVMGTGADRTVVLGVTSHHQYMDFTPTAGGTTSDATGYRVALFLSALDKQVIFRAIGAPTSSVYLIAISDVAAVDILSAVGQQSLTMLPGAPGASNAYLLSSNSLFAAGTLISVPPGFVWYGTVGCAQAPGQACGIVGNGGVYMAYTYGGSTVTPNVWIEEMSATSYSTTSAATGVGWAHGVLVPKG